MVKEVTATRSITPLREGGSLPGLVHRRERNQAEVPGHVFARIKT
ncbi:hypothetical protein ACIQNG_04235 [Streptomyces sp. NPDC091377]